jgi:hypothetical protein
LDLPILGFREMEMFLLFKRNGSGVLVSHHPCRKCSNQHFSFAKHITRWLLDQFGTDMKFPTPMTQNILHHPCRKLHSPSAFVSNLCVVPLYNVVVDDEWELQL